MHLAKLAIKYISKWSIFYLQLKPELHPIRGSLRMLYWKAVSKAADHVQAAGWTVHSSTSACCDWSPSGVSHPSDPFKALSENELHVSSGRLTWLSICYDPTLTTCFPKQGSLSSLTLLNWARQSFHMLVLCPSLAHDEQFSWAATCSQDLQITYWAKTMGSWDIFWFQEYLFHGY